MYKVEVLLSAMNQENMDLIGKTQIKSDVLLINQCNKNLVTEVVEDNRVIRCIHTTSRGLSNSRNMAMENAMGDLGILCDDDEILYKDYVERVVAAFEDLKKADIICFIVNRKDENYPSKPSKVKYFKSLKISSVQMVLKISSIKRAGVKFDKNFGAGSLNSSGEENIFLFDCLKKGLNIYYVPVPIGKLVPSESTWFEGYNEEYFVKRGRIFRRLFGWYGYIHSIYFCLSKYRRYKRELTFIKALRFLYKGMGSKL